MLDTISAQAYVNHGRWIADCPRRFCSNAVALEPRQAQFHCLGGCNLVADVQWPGEADQVWAALLERPVPSTRNWAPGGHRQAVVDGFPNGQTVAELVDETHRHLDIGGQ